MIPCDFCDNLASFAFESTGLVSYGNERVRFCRWHLALYYLGLTSTWHD